MSIQELGICPKCGQADIEYGLGELEDGDYRYACWCPDCGYEGYEYYALEYVGHTDNSDPTGAFIE